MCIIGTVVIFGYLTDSGFWSFLWVLSLLLFSSVLAGAS